MPKFLSGKWTDQFLDIANDLGARPEWDHTGNKFSVGLYRGDDEPMIQAGPSLESAAWAFMTKFFPMTEDQAPA